MEWKSGTYYVYIFLKLYYNEIKNEKMFHCAFFIHFLLTQKYIMEAIINCIKDKYNHVKKIYQDIMEEYERKLQEYNENMKNAITYTSEEFNDIRVKLYQMIKKMTISQEILDRKIFDPILSKEQSFRELINMIGASCFEQYTYVNKNNIMLIINFCKKIEIETNMQYFINMLEKYMQIGNSIHFPVSIIPPREPIKFPESITITFCAKRIGFMDLFSPIEFTSHNNKYQVNILISELKKISDCKLQINEIEPYICSETNLYPHDKDGIIRELNEISLALTKYASLSQEYDVSFSITKSVNEIEALLSTITVSSSYDVHTYS